MSWEEGRSALVADDHMATRQFLNTALLATVMD